MDFSVLLIILFSDDISFDYVLSAAIFCIYI